MIGDFCCFFHTFGVNNILEGERFMKKGVAMLLACALAFGLSACGKGEQMSEMEAIQKQLMEMEGYSCTAELTRTSNKGQNTYGTKQYYKSTGEYRMELTSPESAAGNYTVFGGQQVCQYNSRLGRSLVKDVPESQHRNELFLGQFVKNYMQSEGVTVEAAALDEAKCAVLEAVIPGSDTSVSTEKLWVDRETLLPVRFVIYDAEGEERYRMDYSDFEFNPVFEEGLFAIEENES